MQPRLLTTEQAAQYLNVSRWTVRRLVQSGDLRVITAFKYWRIDRYDLDSWISRTA